jgi:hypothetical protein
MRQRTVINIFLVFGGIVTGLVLAPFAWPHFLQGQHRGKGVTEIHQPLILKQCEDLVQVCVLCSSLAIAFWRGATTCTCQYLPQSTGQHTTGSQGSHSRLPCRHVYLERLAGMCIPTMASLGQLPERCVIQTLPHMCSYTCQVTVLRKCTVPAIACNHLSLCMCLPTQSRLHRLGPTRYLTTITTLCMHPPSSFQQGGQRWGVDGNGQHLLLPVCARLLQVVNEQSECPAVIEL